MLNGWVQRLACICIVLVVVVLFGRACLAQSASVTVGVGDNILVVQGKTIPQAFVTISRDGGVIGTATADSLGVFAHTFPAQEPGIHQVSVYAVAPSGVVTDTATAIVNIAEHATTTTYFFLAPTLVLESSNLAPNEALVVSGEATPSCTIAVYIDDSNYALAHTNAAGQWSVTIPTDKLAAGQHNIYVRAVDGLGEQSYPSAGRHFSISAPPFVPVPSVSSPISPATGSNVRVPNRPTIIFPTPGIVWQAPTILVKGNADAGVQIELFDGNQSLGSVWTDEHGQWSLELSLQSKDYKLQARACRSGICSGLSDQIVFTALLPAGPVLMVEMPRTLFTTTQNAPITLQAQIKSGQPPYSIVVNWGDGVVLEFTQDHAQLAPAHSYTRPGSYTGWLEVQDQSGSRNRIYFSVHVAVNNIMWLVIGLLLLALVCIITIAVRLRNGQVDGRAKSKKHS